MLGDAVEVWKMSGKATDIWKGNRDIVNNDVVFIYPVIIKCFPEKVLINDILFSTYMRCTALNSGKEAPHRPAIIESITFP